jgi:site-specific DNA recombinase
VIDPESGRSEADILRLAWVLLTENDWPCERIAEHLDSEHIPTRNGKRTHKGWAPKVVYQMFTNPVYKGERSYTQADGTIITLPVPALVSVEQWDAAQATLAKHRRSPVRAGARDYLLRGLLRCAECGALYTTSWTRRHDKDGNPLGLHRYYACSTRHFRMQQSHTREGSTFPKDCIGVAISAEKVERDIWADVEEFIREPGPVLLELAARAGDASAQAETHRAALAEVQQQLDASQRERDSVVTMYRKGSITERDLEHQLAELARESAALLARRDAASQALADAVEQEQRMQGARTLLQTLHARLDEVDDGERTPAQQRDIVEKLVKSIRVQTVASGTSARGRVKRSANIEVTYTFDPARSVTLTPAETSAHKLCASSSTWR